VEKVKRDNQQIELYNTIWKDPEIYDALERFKFEDCQNCAQCVLVNKLEGNDLKIHIIECFLDYCETDFF